MSFIELAKRRYSSRNYLNKNVEEEKIKQVLEAGRIAPSAKNSQPWHFIVISKKENLEKICECYKRPWLKEAPVIIAICGDHSKSWRRADGKDHCDIDISIAIDHMTLAATDIDLATCWICKFDVMKAAEILNLPDGIEAIAMLPLGYPADKVDVNRHDKLRKSFDEIVHWEKF
ncbi:MAG: nitroreductase family protein [Bacteroidales bacterium]|nr:nitroreductase family protein [Bacteroidales bacterium]